MKRVALLLLAVFVLAFTSPAFSQPFADVPTDIFAFDAVAELAAKGIIEGFPDGTFKGDRGVTRYELAMVLARILARIEAIKIPPPPGAPPKPEVGRADVVTLQRLVNEFRAELAAQGVRVTAVEEELAALRSRVSNVNMTGDLRFRLNTFPSGSFNCTPSPANPTPGSPNCEADPRLRSRVTFAGQVAPDVRTTLRISANNRAGSGGGTDTGFGNNFAFGSVSFDYLYLDANTSIGWPLNWRIGRQPFTLGGSGPSAYGLLFDPTGAGFRWTTIGFTPAAGQTGNLNAATQAAVVDGAGAKTTLGPIKAQAAVFMERAGGGTVGGTPQITYWLARGTTDVGPGWTLGATYYSERYSPSVSAAIATKSGYGVDATGSIVPGVSAYVDYATWTDANLATGVSAASASAWRAGASIDLSQFGLSSLSPTLDVWYKNYGPLPVGANPPTYSYAATDNEQAFPFNFQGWGVLVGVKFTPAISGSVQYETGNTLQIPTTTGVSEWVFNVDYRMATNTTLSFFWYKSTAACPAGGPAANCITGFPGVSADYDNFYRLQLVTRW